MSMSCPLTLSADDGTFLLEPCNNVDSGHDGMHRVRYESSV